MRLLTSVSMCLGFALAVIAAGIPPSLLTAETVVVTPTHVTGAPTDVVVPTTQQEPDLIKPNEAPIVSNTPAPHTPPPGTCGQAVQVPFLGSVWIQANACHRFTEKGDIPAPVVEFINDGYKNCKSCAFWKNADCEGEVHWRGKVSSVPTTLYFPSGRQPYSYECLDFDSDWP